MSAVISDEHDRYFVVRSERFNDAGTHVVAIFHGVYRSSIDAWLKVNEIIDDLDTQSHAQGLGRGEFIQDLWLRNRWCDANGRTAIFTITPIDAR